MFCFNTTVCITKLGLIAGGKQTSKCRSRYGKPLTWAIQPQGQQAENCCFEKARKLRGLDVEVIDGGTVEIGTDVVNGQQIYAQYLQSVMDLPCGLSINQTYLIFQSNGTMDIEGKNYTIKAGLIKSMMVLSNWPECAENDTSLTIPLRINVKGSGITKLTESKFNVDGTILEFSSKVRTYN